MHRFLMLMLVLPTLALAQSSQQYPFPIVGDGVTEFVFPASSDTFWVFKHGQYLKALGNAEKLEISDSLLVLYKRKLDLNGDILQLRQSMIDSITFGYNHYKDLWRETDEKLEAAEIRAAQRWTFFNVGFILGTLTSAIVIISAS